MRPTPNIDRLATESVRYTHAFRDGSSVFSRAILFNHGLLRDVPGHAQHEVRISAAADGPWLPRFSAGKRLFHFEQREDGLQHVRRRTIDRRVVGRKQQHSSLAQSAGKGGAVLQHL